MKSFNLIEIGTADAELLTEKQCPMFDGFKVMLDDVEWRIVKSIGIVEHEDHPAEASPHQKAIFSKDGDHKFLIENPETGKRLILEVLQSLLMNGYFHSLTGFLGGDGVIVSENVHVSFEPVGPVVSMGCAPPAHDPHAEVLTLDMKDASKKFIPGNYKGVITMSKHEPK